MVKHNNVIPNQHFHKKWQRRVKTWLDQPAQKKIRRAARKEKAAKMAPAPTSGALRPLVHCPTQKYNSKVKLGRGFSLEELKSAGINKKLALTIGISVDHRRTNKCTESKDLNVQRLADYKAKLVVFPRRSGKKNVKAGDSALKTKDFKSVNLGSKPAPAPAVIKMKLTAEMKDFKAHATLRNSRNEARLVGIRDKMSKMEKKEEKAPAAAAGGADE